jgi:phytoene synthase
MISSELDAAGVRDPALREAYRRCRTINAEHGRTFFLATRMLAPEQRPAVHALYGFARRADDILDDFDPIISPKERAEQLERLATQLFTRLVQNNASDDDPALAAVV